MKKFLVFATALLGLLNASCSDHIDDNLDAAQQPAVQQSSTNDLASLLEASGINATIVSSQTITPEQMADRLYGEENATNRVARERFLSDCYNMADSITSVTRANTKYCFSFKTDSIHYQSVDEKGKPVTLSGFFAYPGYQTSDTFYDFKAHHIILMCPHTHCSDPECATACEGKGTEYLGLAASNLFIMPDGQGFGSSKDHDQPYLNHNLQAQQLYDCLCAVFDKYIHGLGEMKDGWTLRVCGASQGGGDAMAVHKYLDTHEDLARLWRFEYSNVCVGPYSPSATFQQYMADGYVTYPCVMPMVIKTMRNANPWFAEKYPEERFFSEKYNLYVKDSVDYHLKMKDLTSDKLMNFIWTLRTSEERDKVTRYNYIYLTNLLSEEILDQNSEMYQDLMKCLTAQDLDKGWTPIHTTRIYCSRYDQIVPYVNSVKLQEFFKANGFRPWVNTGLLCHEDTIALWVLFAIW